MPDVEPHLCPDRAPGGRAPLHPDTSTPTAMILSCPAMKAAEESAFAKGVTAEDLMERAGAGIAGAVSQFFPSPGRLIVFYGKGHNGGDALVAARHLAAAGWAVELRPAFADGKPSPLTRRQVERTERALAGGAAAGQRRPVAIVDGVLGLGASGPPRGAVREAVLAINRLRLALGAKTFAVDLPTGLDGDTGEPGHDCVVADCTVAIGAAKRGLVADAATNFVGRLAVVALPQLELELRGDLLAIPAALAPRLPRRRFDTHKTTCGRVLILAGSEGFTGAALMAAAGASRAGAGLITLGVGRDIYPLVAAAAGASLPEVMVRPLDRRGDVLELEHDVLALGPGLGMGRADEVIEIIARAARPTVVDADGLNALAAGGLAALENPAGPRLLTPHPGEMRRLYPDPGAGRADWARTFVARLPVTLLLKGARTVVAEQGRPLSFNTTGTPAMAAGGMGDVLTGVAAALIAQGLGLYDAARVGAWLCGHAAELALATGGAADEALTAGDVIDFLGPALAALREGCY